MRLKVTAVLLGALLCAGPSADDRRARESVPEAREPRAIIMLRGSDLDGVPTARISSSGPHLAVIDPGGERYAQVERFVSADRRFQASVKRFAPMTLALRDWPIDEFMYFVEGAVEITDANGLSRGYRAGDAIVVPRGFTGTWRQLEPVLMLTVTYGPTA